MVRLAAGRFGGPTAGFPRALGQIPEEVWIAATAPIRRTVILDARPRASRAEERMLLGIHYHADVSAPYDQVARVRVAHAQEWPGSAIQVQRASVGIRVARLLIQFVDQV